MSSDNDCKEGNPLEKKNFKVKKLTFEDDSHASFSSTYEVWDTEKKKCYIIKKIKLVEEKIDRYDTVKEDFLSEIAILKKLKGITPNLVKCWIHTNKDNKVYGYIVLENYCWNKEKDKKYSKCGTADEYLYDEIKGSIYLDGSMTIQNYKKKIREAKDKYCYLDDYDDLKKQKEDLKHKIYKLEKKKELKDDDKDKIDDYEIDLKFIREDLDKVEQFEKQKKLYEDIIHNIKRFDKNRRWTVLQIFEEIKKIHNEKVIIWDVRLPNILYRYSSKNGYEFVIIDFGISHKRSKSKKEKENNLVDMLFDYIALIYDTFNGGKIAYIKDNKKYISLRRLKYHERKIYNEIKQVYKDYKRGRSEIDKKFKYYFNEALELFNS